MKTLSTAVNSLLAAGLIAGITACETTERSEVRVPFETDRAYHSASVESTPSPTAVQNQPIQTPIQKPIEQSKLTAQEQYIRSVIAMRDEGRISDVQASYMIQVLLDKKKMAALENSQTTQATQAAADVSPAAEKETEAKAEVQQQKPEPTFAVYTPKVSLQGRIRSIGSDTMDNVMKYWAIGFKNFHKKIHFFHEGKGSSTATPALMENRSDIGPMSRPMKPTEVAAFKKKYDYEPTQIPVAVDCLAVYVHPDNPIAGKGLTLTQLDQIFSSTSKRGGGTAITKWGQLGLTGVWANKPIKVYGRNNASGTHSLFKQLVLLKGSYRPDVIEKVSSQEVIKEISHDRYSIGYSGIGYNDKRVRVVALSSDGIRAFMPESQSAHTGQYPLSRYLYLTLNIPKDGSKPLQKEFVEYVYSKEGQSVVKQNGFFPVDYSTAQKWLSVVER